MKPSYKITHLSSKILIEQTFGKDGYFMLLNISDITRCDIQNFTEEIYIKIAFNTKASSETFTFQGKKEILEEGRNMYKKINDIVKTYYAPKSDKVMI